MAPFTSLWYQPTRRHVPLNSIFGTIYITVVPKYTSSCPAKQNFWHHLHHCGTKPHVVMSRQTVIITPTAVRPATSHWTKIQSKHSTVKSIQKLLLFSLLPSPSDCANTQYGELAGRPSIQDSISARGIYFSRLQSFLTGCGAHSDSDALFTE